MGIRSPREILMGVVFHSPTPAPTVTESVSTDTSTTAKDSGIEVPYLDYQAEHHKPYSVDHFELGDHWEVFKPEVDAIEGYIKGLIESGKMDNSIKSVKEKLKTIEKMVNSDKSERTVVKIGKLAAYVKFLQETDHIDTESTKYA
jgi:hypothetical protein